MKICMIGAGYVGLVSAACFSDFGWTVTCVDKDENRLAQLKSGRSPIYEPGLDALLERNMTAGRLTFTGELGPAVSGADVVFLAVGTPMRRGDGYADLSYVFSAVEEAAPHFDGFTVVTTKSTVPVGTSREIERRLKIKRPDADVAICSNPEFLREGSAIQDFTHPDRVLVGCDQARAREVMERLYKPLALRGSPVMFVDREVGGTRQVCGQRVSGAQDQLHQRNRGSVRVGRGRCARGGVSHRQGPPHRRQVPASRPWLRWLVLSQGCIGSHPNRARGEISGLDHRAGRARQPRTQTRDGGAH